MIKLKEKKFRIETDADAKKHPAFPKEDTIYNPLTREFIIKQKKISGKDWRLVHNGKKVIDLIEGKGITYTLEKCVEFKTRVEALKEIKILNLDTKEFEILNLDSKDLEGMVIS